LAALVAVPLALGTATSVADRLGEAAATPIATGSASTAARVAGSFRYLLAHWRHVLIDAARR
jgi:hypothetical protein